ncbi:hypothetical protein [Bacillus sp. XF8]|uniref:hypothetical protein n=1 Tax=Bacillus sp. XF8 TaxID=2819289 RepID=UPI001AA02A06|nr:hypothetical protein [Bacillus sp. XF8]MBO1583299.1 hypothetical protein [Bacillus sp. XF8]
MKKIIIGTCLYLPLGFWLTSFCGLSGLETLATMFIVGVTNGIYNVVLEEADK